MAILTGINTSFVATQNVNSVTIKAQEITLDTSDSTTLLRSLASADGFSVVNGKLGAGSAVNGGIAWIHSRNTTSGTKVSTQRFECTNTILTLYQSTSHMDAAIVSYGGVNKEEHLTPDNEDEAAPEVVNPEEGQWPSEHSASGASGGDQQNGASPTAKLTLKCGTPGTGSFTINGEPYTGPVELEIGSTVSVHFEAASGYYFTEWRGLDHSEPDYEFELTEATTLIAEVEEVEEE